MASTVKAVDPRTGREGKGFAEATSQELDEALAAAARAADDPRLTDPDARARLLRAVAGRLRASAEEIVAVAGAETGLPDARLHGELERTAVQLELFAQVVEAGEHLEAIVDHADPDARPVPRPDVRRMLVPLGTVAVFGASNFPLAFSTAGGDTAAALAAGCPVVVKGHPSHPATSALVACLVRTAVAATGLPAGTFGHLVGAGSALGEALVDDPRVRAVAFTGSFAGGTAIASRAAARPVPIPVFAEMGSLNPIVVSAGALAARAKSVADGLAASVATFGGQLCTKPGLVFVPAGCAGDTFIAGVAEQLAARAPEVLLNARTYDRLADGLAALDQLEGVTRLTPLGSDEDPGFRHAPVAYRAELDALARHQVLREEHFGPAVVLVPYADTAQLPAVLGLLGGQLTTTLHAQDDELEALRPLVAAGTANAGRVVFNGFPTGVSVTWAMQHGGPFPASTAPDHTSVGMTATRRFLRPVAYQDLPDALLPPALQEANPLGIVRRVDGRLTGPAA